MKSALIVNLRKRMDLVALSAILLIAGIAYVVAIPIGYGQDEPVHVFRSSSLANGHLFSQKLYDSKTTLGTPISIYGSYVPKAIVDVEGVSYGIKSTIKCEENVCPPLNNDQQHRLQIARDTPIDRHDTILLDFWGVNGYLFVGYIPASIGFFIAQTLHTNADIAIYLGRLFNLFTAIAIIGVAFYVLRKSKLRWIIAATTLLPATVVAMTSIGTDGILDALGILVAAIVVRGFIDGALSRNLKVILAAAAITLPLIKLPYLLLSLSCLFVPSLFPKKTRGWIYKTVFLALIIIPGLVWNLISADMTRTQYLSTHIGIEEPNAPKQIKYLIGHPLDFPKAFGNMIVQNDPMSDMARITQQLNINQPSSLIFAGYIPLIVAILYSAGATGTDRQRRMQVRFALLTLSTSLLLIIGIAAAMYLSYNPVGASSIHGVQGRYLVPIIPFIAISLALLLDTKLTSSLRTKKIFALFALAIPILSVLSYISMK